MLPGLGIDATTLRAYGPAGARGFARAVCGSLRWHVGHAGRAPDPTASGEAVIRIAHADEPPLRAFFGRTPLGVAEKDDESRLETWREWQPVAEIA